MRMMNLSPKGTNYKYKKYLFFGETVEKEEKKDGLLVVFKKAE